jgi:NADH:ubiquinone reductase (non-electrogenic)
VLAIVDTSYSLIMASRLGLRLAPASCRSSIAAPIAARRSLTSLVRTSLPKRQLLLPQASLQQSSRRTYADAPSVNLSPPPKPKKRFRFLRWVWRITYISVLGGAAYLTWQIYDFRNPAHQVEPDPNKKTLVILGWCVTSSVTIC